MKLEGFGRIPAKMVLPKRASDSGFSASFAPAPAVDDRPSWRLRTGNDAALAAYEQTERFAAQAQQSDWLGLHEYV